MQQQEKVKLTFAIPMYNESSNIANTLNSILSQLEEISHFIDLSIVISDNASTDNSLEIVKKYQKNYPNVVTCLHSEENQGATKNILKVVDACPDGLVWILGNDFLMPHAIITWYRHYKKIKHASIPFMHFASFTKNVKQKEINTIIEYPNLKSIITLPTTHFNTLWWISSYIVDKVAWQSAVAQGNFLSLYYPHIEVVCRMCSEKPIALFNRGTYLGTNDNENVWLKAESRKETLFYFICAIEPVKILQKFYFGEQTVNADKFNLNNKFFHYLYWIQSVLKHNLQFLTVEDGLFVINELLEIDAIKLDTHKNLKVYIQDNGMTKGLLEVLKKHIEQTYHRQSKLTKVRRKIKYFYREMMRFDTKKLKFNRKIY